MLLFENGESGFGVQAECSVQHFDHFTNAQLLPLIGEMNNSDQVQVQHHWWWWRWEEIFLRSVDWLVIRVHRPGGGEGQAGTTSSRKSTSAPNDRWWSLKYRRQPRYFSRQPGMPPWLWGVLHSFTTSRLNADIAAIWSSDYISWWSTIPSTSVQCNSMIQRKLANPNQSKCETACKSCFLHHFPSQHK